MPPVMNRAPMMSRPMMNRPMTPMNRVSSAPAATQGIGQALAAQAAAQQSGMPPMGGAGGNMPQGIAAILAGMAAKNPQGQMPQVGQQLPGSPINPELRNQEYLKDLMRAAQTMMGGQMGLGQAMGSPLQTGQYGSQPVMMPPSPQFPMGGLPYDSTNTTTQQDMMGGNRQPPQTNMASNLAQMFNRLGGQQPAQQGGTPLQNGSSPLQQSAQPVMNMGVM